THPVPVEILRKSKTLICTDGATDGVLEAGLTPNLVIGDMDSLQTDPSNLSAEIVTLIGQDSTDLEKALDWCIENGVPKVTLLGVTSGREDHALANLFIVANYSSRLKVVIISDHFTIHCAAPGQWTFLVHRGQRVSLLPLEDSPLITTAGLQYALEEQPLEKGGRGISNRASDEAFSLSIRGGTVLVFIEHLP
ncbi:MAG: thiamine diphosphokinase, partial [Fidelibacterota bacterium]